jgi:hypothetical protein
MKRTALLFAAAVMMLVPAQAQSQEYGHWEVRVLGYNSDGRPRYARVYCRGDRCYRPRRHTIAQHDGTRVYSYERREVYEESGGHSCRDMRRAVGDQHLTVEGAKKAANDAGQGPCVSLGEKFMDLNNARNIVHVLAIVDQRGRRHDAGQPLTRCEIEAQPCHPRARSEPTA